MSDDFQFILYIILAILYFLTRGLSKKKKKDSPPRRPSREQGSPRPAGERSEEELDRPITLEEMLREIGRDYETEEKPSQKEKPAREYVPEHQESEIRDKYEASVKAAEEVKTLDEQVDFDKMKFKRIEVYQEDDEEGPRIDLKEITEAFHNPQSARKAIIYKEILDRKYV